MAAVFNCLPIVEKAMMFTTLEDACYCGALFSTFALLDYTVTPISTFAEFCYEQETNWQALTRIAAYVVQVTTLILFAFSFIFIYGVKKRKRRLITLYMFFVCVNNVALLIYLTLLLAINIVANEGECDYPNITAADIVVRTSVKIIMSLFFITAFCYVLIVAKSFCLEFEAAQRREREKDLEKVAIRIIDEASTSNSKR